MTKDREHEAKSHRSKAKENTKHKQVREAHVEDKVESEPAAPEERGHKGIHKAAARIEREAISSAENSTRTAQLDAEIQEQIRIRAFEIYEQRGREEGHDLDDWLQAEAELTTERWRVLAA
jgi:hypothetical protein